ncbi:FAD-dependent monooxygenase [Actinoallomurus iriomotensis]|uniref:FAD-dependent oxidoreductase n=1 Tax=Actinoallomurus iriomotensis TaxID=478107 RepID=A0A9W6VYE5_9ACTN|nr:FAD-dependent monooxygenase [Actinoallomurus iriomotensis]GLY82761.1 FAD-dependent oxidoreductase [Actinoallomurus iriomotensis]
MTHDVVIIGGGPNGLLLSCELALTGVRPLVLERLAERATTPKANGLVGRVVQALDRRGLHERLSGGDGPPFAVPGFQFGALPLELSRLEDNPMFILPIPQRRLEELLEERALELGVEIRRGHELTALSQTADEVTAELTDPEGAYELTARFLVGADGGRSTVRKRLGIGFPGITDRGFTSRQGQVAIDPPVAVPGTGELEVPGLGRLRPATFTRTEHGVFAYGMFQPGLYRVSAVEWSPSPLEDSTSMPLDELRDAVRRVLGADLPMRVVDGVDPGLRRSAGANSRQAERYRQGRVFLVGDAAHVHSGIGGPGLNLGMQDVLNLGWKLAGEINGWAPEGLLDTYESERRPVGERVIMHTRAQMALTSPGEGITALRALLGELLTDPANIRHIAELMSGADVRYGDGDGHPMTGRWMPDLTLHTESGTTRVATLLRDARPLLLTRTSGAAKAWAGRVEEVTAPDAPAEAVLIRPDGYVAWAGEDTDGLEEALRTWFGTPG